MFYLKAEMQKRKQVLLLNNLPSPYLSPIFSHLSEASNWQLTTCYVSNWNPAAGWTPQNVSQFPQDGSIVLAQRFPKLSYLVGLQFAATWALFLQVICQKYEFFLIYGYTQPPQLFLIIWAWITDVPFAIAGDANYYCNQSRGLKRRVKQQWLTWLARNAANLVTAGTACKMFWESYGAKPHKLSQVGFAVDNDFFKRRVAEMQSQAAQFKKLLGWGGRTVFIYVGRLVERKNINLLIDAMHEVSDLPVALLIVGDGDRRKQLEFQANGSPFIYFTGTASQSELPLYYASADVLVLPARNEPWGLVVNEAMASGLAVISHHHCGAAIDLVCEDNGVLLRSFCVDELVSAMTFLGGGASNLKALKQQSFARIRDWSLDRVAARLQKLINENITYNENI